MELHYNLSKDVIFPPCNTGNVFIVPKDYHISHEKNLTLGFFWKRIPWNSNIFLKKRLNQLKTDVHVGSAEYLIQI